MSTIYIPVPQLPPHKKECATTLDHLFVRTTEVSAASHGNSNETHTPTRRDIHIFNAAIL